MQITQSTNKLINYKIKIIVGLLGYWVIGLFVLPAPAEAQEISLSISPPLTEITIQPGKTFSQTFTVKDSGVPVVIVPSIIPFVPLDSSGHVELIEDQNSINSFASWFSFDPSPISLGTTGSHDFNVKIIPPVATSERDYYFTFMVTVQTDNNLGITNSGSQARIGANMLINISESGNPDKNASIISFTAPKIIDSFTGLTYKVLIGNTGSSFFKPVGIIAVDQVLGKTTTLNLAPLNVLSTGTREISCLNGEDLVPCKLPDRFLIGIYRANLSFTIDGTGPSIEKQIYTVAFPFSAALGIIMIFISYRIIKKLTSYK